VVDARNDIAAEQVKDRKRGESLVVLRDKKVESGGVSKKGK